MIVISTWKYWTKNLVLWIPDSILSLNTLSCTDWSYRDKENCVFTSEQQLWINLHANFQTGNETSVVVNVCFSQPETQAYRLHTRKYICYSWYGCILQTKRKCLPCIYWLCLRWWEWLNLHANSRYISVIEMNKCSFYPPWSIHTIVNHKGVVRAQF